MVSNVLIFVETNCKYWKSSL